ncbi:hypothetical protein Q4562_14795 [Zobellia uliginosa]|nr:hypothetical protein [Zobellia uliginosa]MDO6518514.1 hypothetical protein [Zobellia uliginosa]
MAERCITLLACANPMLFIFLSPMNWVSVPKTGSVAFPKNREAYKITILHF